MVKVAKVNEDGKNSRKSDKKGARNWAEEELEKVQEKG